MLERMGSCIFHAVFQTQGITMIWKSTNTKDNVRKITEKLPVELQKVSKTN